MPDPSPGAVAILRDLNAKFCSNLESAAAHEEPLALRAEVQARAMPTIGEILRKDSRISSWQNDALCMFDEIFADLVCSIYLAACGLTVPANTILRRALEVGVAVVYLWDLPDVFWSWKDHDVDLVFSDMLEHLGKPGFESFVSSENPHYKNGGVIDKKAARALYRKLSNITHGKITTFESGLVNRFKYTEDGWRRQLGQVCEVEDVLLKLFKSRFQTVQESLMDELPQLRMYRNDKDDDKS